METRSTISLSERRPEQEEEEEELEDDDVDAMKVMNRCRERPDNPFLGLARILSNVLRKYIFSFWNHTTHLVQNGSNETNKHSEDV